ncbi:hypothetical protein GCM10023264_21060 [Sphingomonas daechungensis]
MGWDMQPASAARADANIAIGSEELAEGLMLVRASTLKIIRLQLAMERRDRRVALEAVDDLVALDRSLQDFLAHVPVANDDGIFRNLLELERSALNVEKHTLAGGIAGRSREEAVPDPEPADPTDWVYEDIEETPRRPWLAWVFAVAAILTLAAAAFLFGASGYAPDIIREAL